MTDFSRFIQSLDNDRSTGEEEGGKEKEEGEKEGGKEEGEEKKEDGEDKDACGSEGGNDGVVSGVGDDGKQLILTGGVYVCVHKRRLFSMLIITDPFSLHYEQDLSEVEVEELTRILSEPLSYQYSKVQ